MPEHDPASGPNPFIAALLSATTPRDVASILGIEYSRLIYHLYKTPIEKKYTDFTIPKKAGGTRSICSPISPLKIIQKNLVRLLEAVYSPRPSVHGFVADKSILSNARLHAGSKYVLNLDLEDFFPSINFGRVRGMFMARPYKLPASVATTLAQICCHKGTLPQGAPTSPIISNMICAKLDGELQRLAKEHHCRYSRYADDITFSTRRGRLPGAIAITRATAKGVLAEPGILIKQIIQNNGFKINLKKVRLQRHHHRQVVTGLTTNAYPNVSRRLIREIRAILHNCKTDLPAAETAYQTNYRKKHIKPDKTSPALLKAVRGKIEFLGMIRGKTDPLYVKYLKLLKDIAPELVKNIPLTDYKDFIQSSLWVIETDTRQGTGFMLKGYGLITCSHLLDSACYAYRAEDPHTTFPATIVRRGEGDLDLAILSIAADRPDALTPRTIEEREVDIEIILAGYPEFSQGRSAIFDRGRLLGWHKFYQPPRFFISRPIIYGNSGGPVLDLNNNVIGVAIRGAGSEKAGEETSRHEVIPVSFLDALPPI